MSVISLKKSDFIGSYLNKYNRGPVVIFFKATWCGYCTRFSSEYEKFCNLVKDKVVCTVVDIDEESELMTEINSFLYGYTVSSFPTIVMYQNGYFVKKYEGNRDIDDLVKFIS